MTNFLAILKQDYGDVHDYEAKKPLRLLRKLNKIIETNLYLADEELYEACLTFLEWSHKYGAQEDSRFDRSHIEELIEDRAFDDFNKLVEKKYKEARQKYLSN